MKKWKCEGCDEHHEVLSQTCPNYCLRNGMANRHEWKNEHDEEEKKRRNPNGTRWEAEHINNRRFNRVMDHVERDFKEN